MVSLDVKVDRMRDEVTGQFVTNAAFKNLSHAAATIRRSAQASFKPSAKLFQRRRVKGKRQKRARYRPAPVGGPPGVASGRLKRSIIFSADETKKTFFVGPKHSTADEVARAHEFGGTYKGGDYPARPFMQPALERNLHRFAGEWAGSIGE